MSWLLLLRANWKLVGIGLLALFASIQTARLHHAKHSLETARTNLNECRQGRIDDRKAYEDAQRKAAEQNKAEVKRIVGEQEKINANTKSRYERDLARLRAGGLRKDLATPQGSAGCTSSGANGKAAPGADGEKLCLDRSIVLRAAEAEVRLNALIDWVTEQLQVPR